MDPAGSDHQESGSRSLSCEEAVLALVSTRNLYRLPGGPPGLTAGDPGNRLECRPRRALSEESQFAAKTTRTKTKERTIPCNTYDRPGDKRTPPGIASPQRDRAQNPVNTTRTCNKLPPVYRYTAEVM